MNLVSWAKYCGTRGMRMGSGEGSTMRNFIICTVYLIQSGWLNLENKMGRTCSKIEVGSVFKILTVKLIGKRPLGGHTRKWNYYSDPKEIGVNTRNWID